MNNQQRQRREQQRQPYVKVNAYTHTPSRQQVATVVLFAIVVVLHNVFVTSSIGYQQLSILWILLGVTYFLLVFVIFDYLFITCTDPADDILLGRAKPSQQLIKCDQCMINVQKSSYHCHSCDRCVQKFDHHCKYLNNCIGGKNYHSFIRLLINITFFCMTIIGEGIWIFIIASNDSGFNSKIISRWGVLASTIFTFFMMVSVDTLLCFHFYLIFCLKTTTKKYLDRADQESNQEGNRDANQIVNHPVQHADSSKGHIDE